VLGLLVSRRNACTWTGSRSTSYPRLQLVGKVIVGLVEGVLLMAWQGQVQLATGQRILGEIENVLRDSLAIDGLDETTYACVCLVSILASFAASPGSLEMPCLKAGVDLGHALDQGIPGAVINCDQA